MQWPNIFRLSVLAGLAALSTAYAVGQQTRFKVSQNGPTWWFQDSKADKFLSLGVCCVDTGNSFLDYNVANPSYAAYRYYPTKQVWAADIAQRLQTWHFNTLGAWSDLSSMDSSPNSSQFRTPILNLGASAGAPWKDLWSPVVMQAMIKAGRAQIKPDSKVIGYFSDNELGWWEGALFDWIWRSAPESGQRTHFVEILKSRYKTWDALKKDFAPQNVSGFDDLLSSGRLYLRPGGAGMKSIQAYVAVIAGRYYNLCKQVVAKQDPGALYLGDRYISNFYPEVARASKPFVDIVSTNLNADWNDGTFAHFYLNSLEELTAKPILISEYYQASKENRSENKNDSSGFPVAATQLERASRVEVATRFLLSQPYVVGAHWFQYYDEPARGRPDGENYNMGLVDTANKPYEELTGVFAGLDSNQIHTTGTPMGMNAKDGIPLATSDPADLQTWNRTRGFVPSLVDSHRADLYASYSPEGIYLAIYWNEDRFSEAFYQGGQIPPKDYSQVHIRAGKTFVSIAIPPRGPIVVGPGAKLVHEIRGVRNELIVQVPASSLGTDSLQPGGKIDLDVGLATRARAYFGRWRGSFSLGTQR